MAELPKGLMKRAAVLLICLGVILVNSAVSQGATRRKDVTVSWKILPSQSLLVEWKQGEAGRMEVKMDSNVPWDIRIESGAICSHEHSFPFSSEPRTREISLDGKRGKHILQVDERMFEELFVSNEQPKHLKVTIVAL